MLNKTENTTLYHLLKEEVISTKELIACNPDEAKELTEHLNIVRSIMTKLELKNN